MNSPQTMVSVPHNVAQSVMQVGLKFYFASTFFVAIMDQPKAKAIIADWLQGARNRLGTAEEGWGIDLGQVVNLHVVGAQELLRLGIGMPAAQASGEWPNPLPNRSGM